MMCLGTISDTQASDLMCLLRILLTNITKFFLKHCMSVTLGRKVEIGTSVRSTGLNWSTVGWRYASFDCNHAVHVIQLSLIVRPSISHCFSFLNIVSYKLHTISSNQPPLEWDQVAVTYFTHQFQHSFVA